MAKRHSEVWWAVKDDDGFQCFGFRKKSLMEDWLPSAIVRVEIRELPTRKKRKVK